MVIKHEMGSMGFKQLNTTAQLSSHFRWAFLVAHMVRESACNAGGPCSVFQLGSSLGVGKATHSSILAYEVLWTEEPEPDGLQSMGSQRVRHDWVTFTSLQTCNADMARKHAREKYKYWWKVKSFYFAIFKNIFPKKPCLSPSYLLFSLPQLCSSYTHLVNTFQLLQVSSQVFLSQITAPHQINLSSFIL